MAPYLSTPGTRRTNPADHPAPSDDEENSQRSRKRPRTEVSSSPETILPLQDIPSPLPAVDTTTPKFDRASSVATEDWDCQFRYKAVYALLLTWEGDDGNIKVLQHGAWSIEATLRETYKYDTCLWKIPRRKPAREITHILSQFLKANDAAGNLVVVYYGGHALPSAQPGGAPLWVP